MRFLKGGGTPTRVTWPRRYIHTLRLYPYLERLTDTSDCGRAPRLMTPLHSATSDTKNPVLILIMSAYFQPIIVCLELVVEGHGLGRDAVHKQELFLDLRVVRVHRVRLQRLLVLASRHQRVVVPFCSVGWEVRDVQCENQRIRV